MGNVTSRALSIGLIASICIGLTPLKAQASSEITLFNFRTYMPNEGNCEGVAWKAGDELGSLAYASWDARKNLIWLGLGGNVYKSTIQRTEAKRVKVVEANFGDIHAVVTIPQQAIYNPKTHMIGTLQLLSNSTNKSHSKINVSVGEAC